MACVALWRAFLQIASVDMQSLFKHEVSFLHNRECHSQEVQESHENPGTASR